MGASIGVSKSLGGSTTPSTNTACLLVLASFAPALAAIAPAHPVRARAVGPEPADSTHRLALVVMLEHEPAALVLMLLMLVQVVLA